MTTIIPITLPTKNLWQYTQGRHFILESRQPKQLQFRSMEAVDSSRSLQFLDDYFFIFKILLRSILINTFNKNTNNENFFSPIILLTSKYFQQKQRDLKLCHANYEYYFILFIVYSSLFFNCIQLFTKPSNPTSIFYCIIQQKKMIYEKKRVCVVGGGLAGICTTKEVLEENHEVICYEANCEIGGMFATAYDSLHLTVSNYFMAFSSLPPLPHEERRYWTKDEYLQYLQRYIDEFNLNKHIFLKHRVQKITANGEGFDVRVKNSEGVSFTSYFDSVAVCSGSHNVPFIPEIEGLKEFQGEIIHSAEYKEASKFGEKRVVCIGNGESAADITHEISCVAKSCTLSMRSYPSMVLRWLGGHTGDALTANAFYAMGKEGLNAFMHSKAAWNLKKKQDLKPELKIYFEWVTKCGGFLNRFLVKNDAYLKDIAKGRLNYNVGGIDRIDGNKVIFKDGSETEADTLMFNTGYKKVLPFLDPQYQFHNPRDLFKHSIHPEWAEKLVFIGLARPTQGGVPAACEMQARYYALLLSKKRSLPPKPQLLQTIQKDRETEEAFFCNSRDIQSLVSYPSYMSDYADLIGCQPRWWTHLDVNLWYKLWFGSLVPHIYRLSGNGSDKEMASEVVKRLPVAFTWERIFMMFLFIIYYRVVANFVLHLIFQFKIRI
eukprot:TRINITY_DN2786_c0_g1_i2.p1 TRINITY_DN2786_c0_g1~~TRINITY_DN2786_c0_g1_i2.p1  ORF type:complete len:661 (-),score=91.58 TRINITY_DN2786_c0_g1_i2:1017-2999(-)